MAALSILVLLGLGVGQRSTSGCWVCRNTRVRRAALPSAMVWASHPLYPICSLNAENS